MRLPSDTRQPPQRRRLGRHGPEITRIGFGAWAAGGDEWGPQDDARSIAAIQHASTSGINWIDTAPAYGLGHSEEVVGTALAGLGRQDRPRVFTKCSRVWDTRGRITGSLRPASIRREYEASLRRLRLEAIDLYQLHQPDPEDEIEDGWGTLAELKAEGKVRHIGVSNFTVDQMRRLRRIAGIDAVQPEYSLIRRTAEDVVLPFCEAHGIGAIVWSPLMRGLLSGRMTPARLAALPTGDTRRVEPEFREPRLTRNLALVDQLRALADELGCSPAQLAVAWVLHHRAVTGAIVGMRRPEDVEGAVAAGRMTLGEGQLAAIKALIADRNL